MERAKNASEAREGAEPTVESIELEEAVRLAFLRHFPLGYEKKKVALLKAVMQALVVYIIADKRKLLEGMQAQLKKKNEAEGKSDAPI